MRLGSHDASELTVSTTAGSLAPVVRAAATTATDLSDLGALIRESLQQQPRPDSEAASAQAPNVQEPGPDLGAQLRGNLQQQPQSAPEAASVQAPPVSETGPDLGALIRDSLQQQPQPGSEAASGQAPPVQETGPPDVPQPTFQAPEVPQATSQAPESAQSPSQTPEVPQSSGSAATEAARSAPSNEVPAEASSSPAQDISPTLDSVPNDVPSSGNAVSKGGDAMDEACTGRRLCPHMVPVDDMRHPLFVGVMSRRRRGASGWRRS